MEKSYSAAFSSQKLLARALVYSTRSDGDRSSSFKGQQAMTEGERVLRLEMACRSYRVSKAHSCTGMHQDSLQGYFQHIQNSSCHSILSYALVRAACESVQT